MGKAGPLSWIQSGSYFGQATPQVLGGWRKASPPKGDGRGNRSNGSFKTAGRVVVASKVVARAMLHPKGNGTHPPSKRRSFSVVVVVLCVAQLSVECCIRFSRRRTSTRVQGGEAHTLPFFDRVTTGKATGAPLHFPCTFDSCRGFPGEGPTAGFDNTSSVRQSY
jgi:hypothetical protein